MSRETIGLGKVLNDYVVAHQPPEHPALASLREFTGRMATAMLQIAPEQGHLLAFLVRLVGAKTIIEIGTFTGYSALAMVLAMPPEGRLIACDINVEWTNVGKRFWQKAGVAERIDLRIAPASETLQALEAEGRERFDFAFIDADKPGYDDYYERTLRLLRPGGVIVFDNMLQDGAVAKATAKDLDTRSIRALNDKIAADERVDRVLIPVGDGMTLVRKR
jgi:predicted O-methyltransferase YrrM